MDKQYCKGCKYFYQHYTLNDRRIFRVYCGLCAKRIARKVRPDTTACDRFAPAPQEEDTFVSKEYLSKKLLEHVLKMELLPEIYETDNGKMT